ncbi:insulinase family protein [Treponema sp. HNW]|uniref:M16 family metallopeptidase n=1 Tax=Treponema sp. HNW TaxID=3116654 RepID=UPI003D145ABA
MHIHRLFVRLFFRLFLFSFLWFPPGLGAQTDSPERSLPEGFYAYTLENGLELYVQEDFSVPVVKIAYTARAGISYQEQETTGFYRLYSRLFWHSGTGLDAYKKAGAGNFKAECAAHQARYSFTAAVQNFEKTFGLLAHSLKNPSFSDKAVQAEFSALKKESLDWSQSPGGFINTAVHDRVFAAAPWKKDSGVYPALFTEMNTEQIRAKLSYIQKKRYVPNQSALFISGPVKTESVLKIVKNELSDWERSYSPPPLAEEKVRKKKESDTRHFVLVSKDFSKELNQVLIQYTAQTVKTSRAKKEGAEPVRPAGLIETAETFSAAAWAAASVLQSKRETENIDISFTADPEGGRLSIQTLFPAGTNAKQDNPVDSLNKLAERIREQVQHITQADLEAAKKYARLLQQEAFKGVHPFIDALSENWAYGGIEYFYEWPLAVEHISLQDVQNVFGSPWTFLIVHSSQYKLYEKDLAKNGRRLVKPERQVKSPTDTNEKPQAVEPENIQTALEDYGTYTKNSIENFTLSSGIPVSIQRLPNTEWTVCMLNIKGGELKHGYSKKGLESIALLNLARIAESALYSLYEKGELGFLPEVQTEAGLFSGRISVSCASKDIETVSGVLAASFKEKALSPAAADELYFAEAYKRRTASASADSQLKEAALETFFGGSDAEPFFKVSGDTPPSVTYAEIHDACLSLYKPDDFSLIFCTGAETDIKKISELHFGKKSSFYTEAKSLKEDREEKVRPPVPAFSEGERLVRLRRLFFTDIPADRAGERPAKLIPTTDFADPARLYLKSPLPSSRDEVIFAALLDEIAYRMTAEFEKNPQNKGVPASPASSVSAISDIEGFPLASLNFSKVKSKKGVKKAFKAAVSETISALTGSLTGKSKTKESTDVYTPDIKSRYTQNMFFSLSTIERRVLLMQRGIEYNANAAHYVERLLILNKAEKEEFIRVFQTYIQNAALFWIFSADTPE